jgi:LPS O-antigen subunit length determinant protein (WzzB/FepE family)
MVEKPKLDQDELSLLDIYEFFRDGWKTLLAGSVIGLGAGFGTAFILPEKFEASALIEPASVATKVVEPVTVLVEKMKSPTYYSSATIEICGVDQLANPPQALVTRLKPNLPRNNSYAAVTYRAESPVAAARCLEQVLKDVIQNQAQLAKPLINNLEVTLSNAEQELQATTTERDQQRIKNRERLKVAKLKLVAAEAFVEKFSNDGVQFKFGDPQFSASALLLSTLINKQNEIKDLEIQISALEMEIGANMTDKDQRVRTLTNEVTAMKNALTTPSTKPATFAAPIYAPNVKVEPKRSIVILIGLISGGVFGLLLLMGMRVRNKLRQQLVREESK